MAPEESRDVIWMRPEHAATGRPAQRSRAEITAAAVAIAEREGLDAVSMRRVATELGTGAASLYRYRPLPPARGTARTGLTSTGEPGRRSSRRACRPLPRHPRPHPERPPRPGI